MVNEKTQNKLCTTSIMHVHTQGVIFLLYKCPVAKLGSKAGNFLSGKRGGGGGALGRERGELLQIFNLNVCSKI
jgi:hypothetical protein